MWLNALLFQVGWFVCVLERGLLALAATALILGMHLFRHREQPREWLCIAVIAFIGVLQDFLLIQLNVLQFDGQPVPPLWLVAIWLLFASTLNHSLKWLQQRWWLAALLGAISGPLSYLAGERLGALTLNKELLPVLGIAWGMCLPMLFAVLELLKEPKPSCNA